MQKINITFFMMTIFCSFNLSSGSCWLWIPRKDRRTCFTKRCVLIFFKISPLRAFTLSKIFSLDRGEFFFVAKQFFSTYTCTHVPLKMKEAVCLITILFFFRSFKRLWRKIWSTNRQSWQGQFTEHFPFWMKIHFNLHQI